MALFVFVAQRAAIDCRSPRPAASRGLRYDTELSARAFDGPVVAAEAGKNQPGGRVWWWC
ncbi:hypothetical protein BDI4_60029 [Burkholderia diffusa]|nr:hypothetical protein BDI4_60029 [Burkholderia diffusa]